MLLGAALAAAGMIYSGIKGAQASAKAKEELENRREQINKTWKENNDLLSFMANRDYTQTAGFQGAMTNMRRLAKENTDRVAGTNAVMGGNAANVAREKAAQNEVMAQMASSAVQQGEQTANSAKMAQVQNNQNKESQLAGVASQQVAVDVNQAQQNAHAASQLASVAGSMLDSGVGKELNAPADTTTPSTVTSTPSTGTDTTPAALRTPKATFMENYYSLSGNTHIDNLRSKLGLVDNSTGVGKGFNGWSMGSFNNMRRLFG